MPRVPQSLGKRGSLKWIQRAVNDHSVVLDTTLLPILNGARSIAWKSPLRGDEFAEYSDADFLKLLDLDEWSAALAEFWPRRGPQWDALGVSDQGDVLIVEAKAHVKEICSPATQASSTSKGWIQAALSETAVAFGAKPRAAWTDVFYQLANRLAHLYFLRSRGVTAWLALVNFVGDLDMKGPQSYREWEAAYLVAFSVLGIPADAPLMKYVFHLYPDVSKLS